MRHGLNKRSAFEVWALLALTLALILPAGVTLATPPTDKSSRDSATTRATSEPTPKDKKASKTRAPEGEASQEQRQHPRLLGKWPEKIPKITLRQAKGTVGDALRALTKKARWGLMMSVPARHTDKPITIQVSRHPADAVLSMILLGGDLQAELKNGVLVVTPYTGTGAPASPKPGTFSAQGTLNRPATRKKVGGGVDVTRGSKPSEPMNSRESTDASPGEGGRDASSHPNQQRHEGRRDRVVVGSNLRIDPNEEVDSAVAVGGSVAVHGIVHEDAVAVGGSVVLEPGAVVKRNAVAIGGEVKVKEGATLHGDRVSIGGSLKGAVDTLTAVATGSVSWFLFSIVGTFVRSLILFLLALMILTFMPKRSERIGAYLAERPGASTLGGVALAVGFIPFLVLLAITIVGILAIPFAFLALLLLHVIGLTVFMTWLGHKVPLFGDNKSPVLAMTIGLVGITIVDLIPGVGSLLVFLVAFISAGAALLSKLGAPPEEGGPKLKSDGPDSPAGGPKSGSSAQPAPNPAPAPAPTASTSPSTSAPSSGTTASPSKES